MKRYVLGGYELSLFEINLLRRCICSKIDDNVLFMDTHFLTASMQCCFEQENEALKLMLKELECYI